jgi:hypothetical protein
MNLSLVVIYFNIKGTRAKEYANKVNVTRVSFPHTDVLWVPNCLIVAHGCRTTAASTLTLINGRMARGTVPTLGSYHS